MELSDTSAKLLVIVEIFVAQRQAEHPLLQQVGHRVVDQVWIAKVIEALGKMLNDAGLMFHLSKQQSARVRRDGAAVKLSRDLAAR
jgi:hypothetical protein